MCTSLLLCNGKDERELVDLQIMIIQYIMHYITWLVTCLKSRLHLQLVSYHFRKCPISILHDYINTWEVNRQCTSSLLLACHL